MKKIGAAFMMLCVFGLANGDAQAGNIAEAIREFNKANGGARSGNIKNVDDLQAASVVDGSYYVLKNGAYVIGYDNAAPLDISSQASGVNSVKMDGAGASLTLDAGSGMTAAPLTVRDFQLGAGTLNVSGGGAAAGLELGSGTFAGRLVLERRAAAASVHVTGRAAFTETSVVAPRVDLGKTDALAAGLVQGGGSGSLVTIAKGATLKPEFVNTLTLEEGQSREATFIDAGITGEFTLAAPKSLTLEYSAHKNAGSNKYYLGVTRTAYVEDVLDEYDKLEDIEDLFEYDTDNSVELFEGIRLGLPGQSGETAEFLSSLYSRFDNMTTKSDMLAASYEVARGLTAHHDTRHAVRALNKQDAVMQDFRRNLDAIVTRRRADDADECLTRPWLLWASPVYQTTSKREADTPEFDDAKEKFGGISVGMGRDFLGMLTLGVNAHYLNGDVDATGYNAKSDTFGIAAGARLHDVLPIFRILNPWVEFLSGYSGESISQNRRDYSGNWQKSKPKLDMFYSSLTVGNEFGPLLGISISPLIGVEYTHIRQKDYREQGAGSLGLNHNVDDLDSLRLKAGVEARFEPTRRLDFNGHATLRLEVLDNYASLNSSFNQAPQVRFSTSGEDVGRLQGNVGVGVGYRFGKSARIAAGYDVWVADNYVAHQGTLSFSIGF